jgi:hypothetical protein
MLRGNQMFDEIIVYEGVAERTGNTVDRKTVRGSESVCRSMTELVRKARRMGDGYFYLSIPAWPEGQTKVELSTAWVPMS